MARFAWSVVVLLVYMVAYHPVLVDGGVAGLTRFLRTRKQVGESPSWWPALAGPSATARYKAKGKVEHLPHKGDKRKAWTKGANNGTASNTTEPQQQRGASAPPAPYLCDHVRDLMRIASTCFDKRARYVDTHDSSLSTYPLLSGPPGLLPHLPHPLSPPGPLPPSRCAST